MGTRTKNWIVNRTKKAIRDYQWVESQKAQASWLLQNTDKIITLSGKRPGETQQYKIQTDGSWKKVSNTNQFSSVKGVEYNKLGFPENEC